MTREYVHVGAHADVLSNGRGVGPGDRVREDELTDEDRHHIGEDGPLVDVASFGSGASNTPEKSSKSTAKTEGKGDA